MKTDTRQNILDYIKVHSKARPDELGQILHLSQVAIHKQLKNLLLSGTITRLGRPPLVYYQISTPTPPTKSINITLPETTENCLNDSYLYITGRGEVMVGIPGFIYWATQVNRTKDVITLAEKYCHLRQSIDHQKSNDLLDVTSKVHATFPGSSLDRVYCQDVYSLPMFGKTKLGQQTLIAKQSQNQLMMLHLASEARSALSQLIRQFQINTIAFIPPTMPRKTQFMTEFAKAANLNLPKIDLLKIKAGEILVPQKSLSNLNERVLNASNTILVKSYPIIQSSLRILLIDDAVGSGATLNQTALKLKSELHAETIIGFGLVASYKGFDVITDI